MPVLLQDLGEDKSLAAGYTTEAGCMEQPNGHCNLVRPSFRRGHLKPGQRTEIGGHSSLLDALEGKEC